MQDKLELHIDNHPIVWYTVGDESGKTGRSRVESLRAGPGGEIVNRKIQYTDREFIVARYLRDRHAFCAVKEALAYKVSLRTIYNLISQAGIQMRRGRKPLVAPGSGPPAPPPLSPLLGLIIASEPLLHPKPHIPEKPDFRDRNTGKTRKGPPAIHPPKPRNKSAD